MSVRAQRGRKVSFCSLVPNRHADRLVRGEQRADGGAGRADQGQGPVVVDLGEPQTAVLRVDLHAEGAEFLEPLHGLVRNLPLALDPGGVDLGLAEVAQGGEELLAAAHVVDRGGRVRMDEVEPETPQEQFLGEAGLAPVLLAGRSATWRASRSETLRMDGAVIRSSPRRGIGSSAPAGRSAAGQRYL